MDLPHTTIPGDVQSSALFRRTLISQAITALLHSLNGVKHCVDPGTYGIPTGYLQDTYRIPSGYLQDTFRIPMYMISRIAAFD